LGSERSERKVVARRPLTIVTFYHPQLDGPAAVAMRVTEALAPRGRSVTVPTTRHLPDLVRQEMLNDITQIHTPPLVRAAGIGRLEKIVAETP
jgi:hypothetical protein